MIAMDKSAERRALGEPGLTDQPLPLPQNDDGCEPPENNKDEAPDPCARKREASHHGRGGDAGLEIRAEAPGRRPRTAGSPPLTATRRSSRSRLDGGGFDESAKTALARRVLVERGKERGVVKIGP